MDSTTDTAALRSDAKLKAQGEAIADGLAVYFNLKLKKEEINVPKVDISKLPASASHAASWDWATKQGLVNGERPRENVTREQLASILKSYDDKNK